jgi:hypothetical protein
MARLVAFVAVATLLGVGLPRAARAEDASHAEETFQRGRALLSEGKYAEACKAFEMSQKEDPASGTLLALADCQELSGLLASAWANYRAAAELAQREGHSDRRDAAADQSRVLMDRVSVLTIVVPPSIAGQPGLKVTLDGAEVARSSFGSALPVDGGTYRVEATVGQTSWSATVTVGGERDKKTIVVELLPPRRGETPAEPEGTQPAKSEPRDERHDSRTLEHVGLAGGITGLATIGVGLGFGIVANSKHQASERNGHCDATGCDSEGMELENDAIAAARVSTWCVIGGSVLAVGGAVLYFGAKSSSPSSQARVGASVSPAGAQLFFKETF